MKKKMDKVVASIWRNGNHLLQSKGDLINLASLIEAEAKNNFEKYTISSVFSKNQHNISQIYISPFPYKNCKNTNVK